MNSRTPLSKDSRLTLSKLALVHFLRLTGVFFLIPLIVIYARTMTSSYFLAGVALGSYEIAMAAMQLPSTYLYKRLGKKNYIYIGMSLFVLGNIICYLTGDIYVLIIGRFIEGMGAISSPITALSLDAVPTDRRSTAMAFTGIGIGFAFLGGLGLASIIGNYIGIRNFFLISAVLGVLAILVITSIHERPLEKIIENANDGGKKNSITVLISSISLALVTFLFFFILQRTYYISLGFFYYGIIILLAVIISAIVAIYLSEVVNRKKPFNVFGLGLWLIFAGTIIFFGVLFVKPIAILALLSMIPFITGFTIYEIVAIPTLFNSSSMEGKEHLLGIYFTLQYAGNGIGSLVAGFLASVFFKITMLEIFFVVAVIFSLISVISNAINKRSLSKQQSTLS